METKQELKPEVGLDNNGLRDKELEDEEEFQEELDNPTEDDDEEIEEEPEEPKENKKSTLTFFMIFFPSVILSIIPSTINGGSIIPFGIKGCILLLQLVILKNFVDTYYE